MVSVVVVADGGGEEMFLKRRETRERTLVCLLSIDVIIREGKDGKCQNSARTLLCSDLVRSSRSNTAHPSRLFSLQTKDATENFGAPNARVTR